MAPKMESLHHSTDNDFTMLHFAAAKGHADVVQLAIDEYKLDPTARTKVCVAGHACSCLAMGSRASGGLCNVRCM